MTSLAATSSGVSGDAVWPSRSIPRALAIRSAIGSAALPWTASNPAEAMDTGLPFKAALTTRAANALRMMLPWQTINTLLAERRHAVIRAGLRRMRPMASLVHQRAILPDPRPAKSFTEPQQNPQ